MLYQDMGGWDEDVENQTVFDLAANMDLLRTPSASLSDLVRMGSARMEGSPMRISQATEQDWAQQLSGVAEGLVGADAPPAPDPAPGIGWGVVTTTGVGSNLDVSGCSVPPQSVSSADLGPDVHHGSRCSSESLSAQSGSFVQAAPSPSSFSGPDTISLLDLTAHVRSQTEMHGAEAAAAAPAAGRLVSGMVPAGLPSDEAQPGYFELLQEALQSMSKEHAGQAAAAGAGSRAGIAAASRTSRVTK
jgi:hypothetical protein